MLGSVLTGVTLIGLVLGSLAGLVMGIALLTRPGVRDALEMTPSEVFHKWVWSMTVERFVYRHHRLFGGGISLISAIILHVLWSHLARELGEPTPKGSASSRHVREWIWDSFVLFTALSTLFTLGVGLCITFRPSLLKRFEAWANQQFSGEAVKSHVQYLRSLPSRLLHTHPRLMGLLLIFFSGWALYELFENFW
ncbi:MAG: hypothetical protein HQL52_08420 [Magnetococcales bacterium]|nr:hypothetical protein [Magnetococcales bacterium]